MRAAGGPAVHSLKGSQPVAAVEQDPSRRKALLPRALAGLVLLALLAPFLLILRQTVLRGRVRMPSRELCVRKCNAASRRVAEFLRSSGYESEPVVFDGIPMVARDSTDYDVEVAELRKRGVIEIELLGESGEIVLYFDYVSFDRAFGKGAGLFASPPPPRWTTAKAARVAEGYLKAVSGRELDPSLRCVNVRYGHQARERAKSRLGSWFVKWSPTDKLGNVMEDAFVIVKMTEDFGPFMVRVSLPSLAR